MTIRQIVAENAYYRDLTPQGEGGGALKRFRRKLAADGFATDEGWRPKPGYLYTVVRAISARVNQNYDGWPSEELKKSYKTFIGKPVFVNHENHDPTKARGVVVAARYVENGMDKYVETVMEVDAGRFPKLAHEIKTGGLDSVSMGAEAGFTICSYCHNKATDLDDMCSHVRNHKGKTLTRFDKRTGKKEDVLVFESCLVPGTPVLMADGTTKSIEQVQVGDRVIDHLGESRLVTETMSRLVTEDIVRLRRTGYPGWLELTGNHPLLVVRSADAAYPSSKDGKHSFSKEAFARKLDQGRVRPEFVEAAEIREGDWVVEVIPQRDGGITKIVTADYTAPRNMDWIGQNHLPDTSSDEEFFPAGLYDGRWKNRDRQPWIRRSCHAAGCDNVMELRPSDRARMYCSSVCAGTWRKGKNVGDKNGNLTRHTLPDTVELTESFGRLVGWFLAEGSASSAAVNFALHADETTQAQEIVDLVRDCLGLTSVTVSNPTPTTLSVTVFSAPFARLMSIFGTRSAVKGLPDEFMSAPLEFLRGVADAHELGDGLHGNESSPEDQRKDSVRPHVHRHFTVSDRLASQLYLIHLMLGRTPSQTTKAAFRDNWLPLHDVWWKNIATRHGRNTLTVRGKMAYGPWVFTRVRDAETIPYSGPVHNLEVADSHTYTANGLAVHNCHKISFFELSYVFEPADETAVASKVVVAGLDRTAGECPPGMDCSRNIAQGEQIGKDTPNNPVNQVSYTPGTIGQPGGSASGGYQGNGKSGRDGLNPAVRDFYDQVAKEHPDLSLGGYNPTVDQSWDEHHTGDAMDIMVSDLERGNTLKDRALGSGAKHVIWQQKLWYPGGGSEAMPDRGSPTENHFDHVHINIPTPAGYKAPTTTTQQVSQTTPAQTTTAPAQRAAGKYTKDDFAIADGKKPWERETKSEDDEAIREIEAMVRVAMPFIPENTGRTQRPGTMGTYRKVHDFFDAAGAPGEGREGVLDYGAGLGHSAEFGHTYEPNPKNGFEPTYVRPEDVPPGAHHRVTCLNVLNVVPPDIRRQIVEGVGQTLAPGGHAVFTTRDYADIKGTKNAVSAEDEFGDPGAVRVNPDTPEETYQKPFSRAELADYVQGVLGDGYAVRPVPLGPAGVHVVKQAANRRKVRSAALKKIARTRARKLAWGEKEAPAMVDTLREEGSAPEDDNNDDQRYVDPVDSPFENAISSPAELQAPDLSQAAQIDREQELAGQANQAGVPGPAEGGPPQDQGNFITLKIPMPGPAPQVPQQAGPPVPAMPPAPPAPVPAPQTPPPVTAAVLDYFDSYYGRRVANWLDAIEVGRDMTPAEAADYRRQAAKLSTLENGRELSTTDRNPRKGTATMARTNIASRGKVASAGRRQHFAEGPLVDGGDRSRNDQGEQEEVFISQTPPEESVVAPTDDTNISNTEHNLVARVQRGRDQLLRDAQALASLRQRRAFDEAGGPTAEVVDPKVQTGPEGEALTGTDFVSADPNDGVVPTNPKDASLRAFKAFDGWLAQKTGKSSRRHSEATIKQAAAQFSREAGISPQALFPALGIVLREARKNDKQANTKGAKMRKRADEKLEVAAPDGRVDVEAPVSNITDAEAQASQFDLHDFGNNAGDNVADPDLSTDQNWAPGEASKTSAIKTAGGLLAMRCAEGMIEAGLEPNSRERKYQLAAEFEGMNRGLIQDRVALLERFAAVRQAERRKVASGSSRGAARSPIPAGLGSGTHTASAPMQRMAAHDPSNDSALFL